MNFSQTKTSLDTPDQGSTQNFIKGPELDMTDENDNIL